ncbi:MAG: preprotein translocase subunit YajC [Planctomycetota bacterium]
MNTFLLTLLAQAGDPAATGADPAAAPPSAWTTMLPLFVIMYLIVYFIMIRPQKKQQQEHKALLEGLKKNDEVRTSGGIIGKVAAIDVDKDIVTLKIDEQQNVRMRVLRGAIAAVIDSKANKTQGNKKLETASKS